MSEGASLPKRYYLYPVILTAAIGAAFFAFRPRPPGGPGTAPTVELGKDYYVTVALLELTETDSSGNPWDTMSESGPDIFVEIYWKGNRIYRSTKKEDTFVAKWSNAELNIRNLALSGQNASMDDIIHAARLNIKPGEEIEIRAFDSDLLGSAEAGKLVLKTDTLPLGDTTYDLQGPGVKRIVVRVSDMTQAVDPLE